MGFRYSDVVRGAFREALLAGATASRAADEVGVAVSTGGRWAREWGMSRPPGAPTRLTARERARVAGLLEAGWRPAEAARRAGVPARQASYLAQASRAGRAGVAACRVEPAGDDGVMEDGGRRGFRLSEREREEIAVSRAAGLSVTGIAGLLGRSKSTVSRELARGSGADGSYRGWRAQAWALERARRPKPSKLATEGRLREYVQRGLGAGWSPEQIERRLRADHPTDGGMRVSHETVYQAVYVQARGGLRREVQDALRHGRACRRPRRKETCRRPRIKDMVNISERPPEVRDRAVPGHWEGDLVMGSMNKTAVSTLVERTTRLVMLGHLPAGHGAADVQGAIVPLLKSLPDLMRRSLTWDQGSEMASHLEIAAEADLRVFFCDPRSPWQRGTNENTNGLLRQYLPKGTDLSVFTPDDLARIADRLNTRPRKTLNWLTPAEAYALLLGHEVQIGGRDARDIAPDWLKPPPPTDDTQPALS